MPLNLGLLYVLEMSLLLLRLELEFPGHLWESRLGFWKIAYINLGKDGNSNKYSTSTICLLF